MCRSSPRCLIREDGEWTTGAGERKKEKLIPRRRFCTVEEKVTGPKPSVVRTGPRWGGGGEGRKRSLEGRRRGSGTGRGKETGPFGRKGIYLQRRNRKRIINRVAVGFTVRESFTVLPDPPSNEPLFLIWFVLKKCFFPKIFRGELTGKRSRFLRYRNFESRK